MQNIVAICGSLRRQSYNLKLLMNFRSLLPARVACEVITLHDIPLYSEDEEAIGFPQSVQSLVDKISRADLVLFGCPEYNYSVPGVLKNAIDWISRHPKKPLAKKPAAVVGASIGRLGGARAQYHLRQIAVFVDLRFINRPEIMVAEAHKKFDGEGKLIDQPTIDHLKKLVDALINSDGILKQI
jgi:chromate reductase, NAD(P)H dehydrogenase (quinone)